jgi:UDPglucose 6-dehydrogenase
MRISVAGCGYLGAVHVASLVELGHDVVGIDVDERKVAALSRGLSPFYEPGFQELLEHSLASGRPQFSTDVNPCRRGSGALPLRRNATEAR